MLLWYGLILRRMGMKDDTMMVLFVGDFGVAMSVVWRVAIGF